jgi:uncharacterized protein YggE
MARTAVVLGVAALGVVVGFGGASRAQQSPDEPAVERPLTDRVSLSVDGHAVAPADQVEIELLVLGSAEEGADAETGHRAKLRGVLKALSELKSSFDEDAAAAAAGARAPAKDPPRDEAPKDPAKSAPTKEAPAPAAPEKDAGAEPPSFAIEVREAASMIGVMPGVSYRSSKPGSTVSIATGVVVKMEGLATVSRPKLRKRLVKIIDTALEAGVESGTGDARLRPSLRFQVKDHEALREAAYKDAITKARERASRLARLGGRELGPLSGISETAWSLRANRAEYRGANNANQNRWVQVVHQQRRADGQGFAALMGPADEMTSAMTQLELEVTLSLEFELGRVTAAPETAPAAAPGPGK